MKKALALAELDIIGSFFEDGTLYGIQSGCMDVQLCSILNKRLNYNFRLAPELELSKKFDDGFGLFSNITPTFSTFTNLMPPCITSMYLYNNHFEDIYLVDALKQYPFLLLIYNENMLLYQQPVLEILSAIDSIQRIDPIAIDNVKEIENLIL